LETVIISIIEIQNNVIANELFSEGIKKLQTYTKAPPALPNLVTLPFPKELFMSFIAASRAFCCR